MEHGGASAGEDAEAFLAAIPTTRRERPRHAVLVKVRQGRWARRCHTWAADGRRVFESESQARQLAEAASSVADDLPIEILGVEVYEVDAEA